MECKNCIEIEKVTKSIEYNSNSIKEINNKIEKMDNELELTIRNRIRDSEKQNNLYSLLESIDNKLTSFLEDFKEESRETKKAMNDTNFRVSEIERKLAINDTKTQMSIDLNWKTIAVIGSFLTLIAGVVVNSIWG